MTFFLNFDVIIWLDDNINLYNFLDDNVVILMITKIFPENVPLSLLGGGG
jgi:hypothetical protein